MENELDLKNEVLNYDLKERMKVISFLSIHYLLLYLRYTNTQINGEAKAMSKFRKCVSESPSIPKTVHGASILIRTTGV